MKERPTLTEDTLRRRTDRSKKYRASHKEQLAIRQKAYRNAHREEIKIREREYRIAHKEKKAAYQKAYCVAHRKELAASTRAYFATHREEKAAYDKAYRSAHMEEELAREKAYRTTHKKEIAIRSKTYYEAHREEMKARKRELNYSLSKTEFDALLKDQGNVCAICGKSEWKGRGPQVDHDHLTGKVRGILCYACNIALGLIGDNSKTARALVAYLRRKL